MDNKQTGLWFAFAWFGATATTLIFSLLFSVYLSTTKVVKPSVQSFKLYAALPKSESLISDDISHADGRANIIESFFQKYKAPLSEFSQTFVEVADKYKLDYRLLPAISMQESNGGKKVIASSYNPFGYGIYGQKVTKFASWEEGIDTVGKGLRDNYLNIGLKTPFQIMGKYTPPSLKKEGAWAKGVTAFMEELR